MAIVRGCGLRVIGGIYAMTELSPNGKPLEYFLWDPPRPVPEGLRFSLQGQTLIENGSSQGMIDYLGLASWPNAADWVEEVSRYGASFHIRKDIARQLKYGARALPLHARGLLLNWNSLPPRWFKNCIQSQWPEARQKNSHFIPGDQLNYTDRDAPWWTSVYPDWDEENFIYGQHHCTSYLWSMVIGGEPLSQDEDPDGLLVRRSMPSFSYLCVPMPPSVQPVYETAFLGSLPIHRLEIVRGNEVGEQAFDELRKLNLLEVLMVDD